MTLTKQGEFTKKVTDLPDTPSPDYTATEIKTYFQTPADELKTSHNKLVDELTANTGAGELGAKDETGATSTVQAMLDKIKNKTDNTGNHQGTWQGLTPSGIGNETINGGRLDIIEGEHVNVKRFGAKGDGVTDDTQAIMDALNSIKLTGGGILYFPDGIYKVSKVNTSDMTASALLIDFDNVTIIGTGNKSVIKAVGDGNSYFHILKLTTAKNVKVMNLKFDGNADAYWNTDPVTPRNGYHCIYFNPPIDGDVDNIIINNCHFRGSMDSAIQSYGSSAQTYPHPISKRIKIIHSHFEQTGAHGVGMNEWYNSIVTNCSFYDLGKKPVLLGGLGSGMAVDVSGGCKNIVVSHNVGEKTGYAAFKVETHDNGGVDVLSENVVIIGNVIRNLNFETNLGTNGSSQYGIRVNGKNVKVAQNIIDGYYGRAIDLSTNAIDCEITDNQLIAVTDGNGENNGIDIASDNHKITNNTLKNPRGVGIFANNSDSILIQGNTVENAKIDGIRLSGASNITIAKNVIKDNASVGIYVVGSSSKVIIVDNLVFDSRTGASRTQQNGITIDTTITEIEMDNNKSYNNVSNNYAVMGHLTQRIIQNKKILNFDSMPASGTWSVGDYVDKTNKQILGSAGSRYVLKGWTRITNGTNNVLNTDWVEDRALTGT